MTAQLIEVAGHRYAGLSEVVVVNSTASALNEPSSVGLVCRCGQAAAGLPGSTVTCPGCGSIYVVSVMRIA